MENRLINEIYELLEKKPHVIVGIDGRCASGKTTLAKRLKEKLDCNLISADEFFLRPQQRTAERLAEPGGNIDYERLEHEVLIPLRSGIIFKYRPYDCHTQSLKEPIAVSQNRISIVEGSYCCHPMLLKYYDYKVFMTVDKAEQLKRIADRNGNDGVKVFADKWIPLEEKYFAECDTEKYCDLVIGGGNKVKN